MEHAVGPGRFWRDGRVHPRDQADPDLRYCRDVDRLQRAVSFSSLSLSLNFTRLFTHSISLSPPSLHSLDLPGVKPEDLSVDIDNDCLLIRGERKGVHEEEDALTHQIERSYGRVRRSIPIPRAADQANASVKFEHGVLVISFPKVPGVDTGARRRLAIQHL